MPEEEKGDETPFGQFEVKCKKCGSTNVKLVKYLGSSEDIGIGVSIDMVCFDCGNRISLYET